uniref:cysteine dioxygenase n=1 Tax=Musa acuminata subsp. malaccensis TaxID=214687 RepID=A0A804I967_MUSAM
MEAEGSKMQRLYDACDMVFSSGRAELPTPRQLGWLQGILDAMEPADVGIDGSSGDESTSCVASSHGLILGHAIKQITYIHIHECEDFSIGVFCFPAGARLPLHDHPRMVVLTKVLYGSIALKSYDWVTTPISNPKRSGLAKVVADDSVLQASSKASVLFPRSGGNIHSLIALTPCAILDVLAPPYSEEQGRPSTYYVDIPIPPLPGFVVLEEIDTPDDLRVAGAPYLGPELLFDLDSC